MPNSASRTSRSRRVVLPAEVWTPELSRARSPPRRPSMTKPSTVTPSARTRTTLPWPEPSSTGRPWPTRRRGSSITRSPRYTPAATSTTAPGAAESIRAWRGERSAEGGRPSTAPGAIAAICSAAVASAAEAARAIAAAATRAPSFAALPFTRRLPASGRRAPPLPPREEQRAREQEGGGGEGVGAGLRIGVDLEVRELLVAEQRRHEGVDAHRRLRV